MSRGDGRPELDLSLVNCVSRSGNRDSGGRKGASKVTVTYRSDDDYYDDDYDYNQRPGKSDNRNRKNNYTSSSHRDNNHKNSKNKRHKKKKHRVLRTVLGFILVNALLLFLAVKYVPGAKNFLLSNCGGSLLKCFLSEDAYNNIFDNNFNKNDILVNEGVDKSKFSGYYTIALFGIDARDGKIDSGVNSDSIILVSINQDTGKVLMSSIYRDTWLRIPTDDGDYTYRKINSAFSSGGAKAAINAMNANFDLHISDYVTVNFQGLATIIDMLGGLDMTITEDEKYYINQYLDENIAVTGIDSPDVSQSGNVHLNGIQAVAYCRIRYCAYYAPDGTKYTDDMGRTARQRYVLSLMIEKAKSAGVSKVMDIAEKVFSGDENIIKTSIPYDDMMDMIPAFIDFELGETKGFPFTYDFPRSSLTNGQSALAPGGLVYNVRMLHEFLYGDNDYVPSHKVIEIDAEIKEKTGIDDIELP